MTDHNKVIVLGQLGHMARMTEAMMTLLDAPIDRGVIVIKPDDYDDWLSRPIDPRPSYELLGYTKRHMEANQAKAAKAEAKRQRRRKRNQRIANGSA